MAANNSGKAQLKKITVVTLEIKKQCPTMLLDVTSVSSWQHYWDRRMKLKGDICGGKWSSRDPCTDPEKSSDRYIL